MWMLQVTVWATVQEDPAKTIHKWKQIPRPDSEGVHAEQLRAAAAAGDEGRDAGDDVEGNSGCKEPGGKSLSSADGGCCSAAPPAATSGGADFFVPWNLPCHRAEAQGAMSKAQGGAEAPNVDHKKGAVVYQRYYHLFTEAELSSLVASLPNARTLDVFYDKSNWCIVFEKKPS